VAAEHDDRVDVDIVPPAARELPLHELVAVGANRLAEELGTDVGAVGKGENAHRPLLPDRDVLFLEQPTKKRRTGGRLGDPVGLVIVVEEGVDLILLLLKKA
jgi:hypothetical protein